MKLKPKVLFISTDGIMEPLGESQVLSYLNHLSSSFLFTLISAEKQNDLKNQKKFNQFKNLNNNNEIEWKPIQFQPASHRTKKILNFFRFSFIIFITSFKEKYSFFHLRSLLSGLLALPTIFLLRKKFIFDIRGFWIDERVDRSNLSKNSFTYKFFKFVESFLLRRADAIICLTHESKTLLSGMGYSNKKIFVIRTCAEEKYFFPRKNNIDSFYINFVHLGSIHTAYDLLPVLKFFDFFSFKNFKLTVLTKDISNQGLKEIIDRNGFKIKNFEVISLDFNEVPAFLRKMDVGIFFAKENFSIKASFPTKIAEFLATGIPIICNRFNSDIDMIEENNLGVLTDFSTEDFEMKKFEAFFSSLDDSEIRNRCISKFNKEFTNTRGVEEYKRIYDKLL